MQLGWIRQTIERAFMNQTRTIRLPNTLFSLKSSIYIFELLESCLQELDHEPTAEEIAAATLVSQ